MATAINGGRRQAAVVWQVGLQRHGRVIMCPKLFTCNAATGVATALKTGGQAGVFIRNTVTGQVA